MNLFEMFRKRSTAPVARDRLQVLLAHERSVIGSSDLMATLREEILAVIARHVPVDRDAVQIKMDRGAKVSMLEIDVEVPLNANKSTRPAAGPGPGPGVPASA
jgi:cell division topological specificity factor